LLANDASVTTSAQIGVTWSPGAESGGTAVLDYNLFYDQGNSADADQFVMLDSGLTATSYTVMGLLAGTTYTFKVQARNEYGLSAYSDTVSILAAEVPA
jgi:hypothetical protein